MSGQTDKQTEMFAIDINFTGEISGKRFWHLVLHKRDEWRNDEGEALVSLRVDVGG